MTFVTFLLDKNKSNKMEVLYKLQRIINIFVDDVITLDMECNMTIKLWVCWYTKQSFFYITDDILTCQSVSIYGLYHIRGCSEMTSTKRGGGGSIPKDDFR